MADDEAPGGFSLRRWSRRKLEAARAAPAAAAPSRPPAPAEPASPPVVALPADGAARPAAGAPAGGAAGPEPQPVSLPPVESLHFDSDFTPFMQPKVDAALKREALKKLFRDPRFNVMDGLDIYIGDYSQPDPIAPEVVRQLHHVRSFFDPPKTRVNAQGWVEDVPPEAAPAAALPEPVPDADADARMPPATVPAPVTGAPLAAAPDRAAVAIPATVPAAGATAGATAAAPGVTATAPADGDTLRRDHEPSKP